MARKKGKMVEEGQTVFKDESDNHAAKKKRSGASTTVRSEASTTVPPALQFLMMDGWVGSEVIHAPKAPFEVIHEFVGGSMPDGAPWLQMRSWQAVCKDWRRSFRLYSLEFDR
jgi:hypothetical protein